MKAVRLMMRWLMPASLSMLAIINGCASQARDLFEPDWDRVLAEEEATRETIPVDAPARPPGELPLNVPDLVGDGPLSLTIEQAALLALDMNRELQVAQLTPEIAGAFEMIELGVFDPEVFANVDFATEEVQETARTTGEQFGVRGDERRYEVGVRQTLPSGTGIEVGLTQDRTASSRSPEQQSARFGMTITQSLLRGFGPVVNLALVRQAELETVASRFELRRFIEVLLAETEVAYWNYVLARREIEIFERSLAVAQTQAEQVRERISVGVLSEAESAAPESEVALREQALIEARSSVEATRLELLRRINALGIVPPDRALIPLSPPDIEPEPIIDVEDRLEVARRYRPDVNEARVRFDQNRLETVRTRNGLLPRLDVFIALGKSGYGDTFEQTFREIDENGFDASIGLAASQSIERLAARGAHRVAIATRQQSAAAIRNLEQLIELDVLLAVNEVERARQQIEASATTRRLQARTAEAEGQRFEAGTSTAILVAQAQRDLLQAEIAEVESILAYRIALIELYLAEGTLLERRGIVVPD